GRVEDRRDLPQPVRPERRAGRDQVDDRIGDAEVRRDLGRAGDRDDGDLATGLTEEAAGEARERSRDTGPGRDVIDRPDPAFLAGGEDEATASEAQVEERFDRPAGLLDQVA